MIVSSQLAAAKMKTEPEILTFEIVLVLR